MTSPDSPELMDGATRYLANLQAVQLHRSIELSQLNGTRYETYYCTEINAGYFLQTLHRLFVPASLDENNTLSVPPRYYLQANKLLNKWYAKHEELAALSDEDLVEEWEASYVEVMTCEELIEWLKARSPDSIVTIHGQPLQQLKIRVTIGKVDLR